MSLRDLFVEIGVDVNDDPLKDLDLAVDDIKDVFKDMDGLEVFGDIEKDTRSVADEFDDLTKDVKMTDKAIDDLDDNDLNGLEKETKKVNSAMDILKKGILAAGIAIASYFTIDTIKDFAIGAIEAAASVQAIDAQFEQVFGNIEDTARSTLDDLGNQFGMLPTRLTAPYAQMTSMFKGLGYDTQEASKMAADGLTLVADAAAFYDMSFEDANSSLNSFIKGNYEGGEAIGLFANDTQLAAFAVKEGIVGATKDWADLDEATKQATRLDYAQNMQTLAGATGQASRESEGFENVMGNLKQAWTDFQAVAGQEFLPHVITGIQWLTEKIVSFDPSPVVDGIFAIADGTTTAYDAITNFIATYDWLIAGIAGGVAAYYAITGAMALYNAVVLFAMGTGPIYTAVTGAMTAVTTGFGAAMAFVTSPIGLVVLAIGAVIAIGVLLWKNWDTVKEKASSLWQKLMDNPLLALAAGPFGALVAAGITLYKNFDKIKDAFGKFKDAISNFKLPGWVSSIGGTLSSAAGKVKNLFDGSHASGLGRVPFDGYIAELHKNEAVIQADEADVLRSVGVLSGDGSNPKINLPNPNGDGNGSGDDSSTPLLVSGVAGNESISVGGITIIVQGGNTNGETAKNIRDVIDEYFADLGMVLGG